MAFGRYSSGRATGRSALRERAAAGVLSAALVGAIGWGLALGLGVSLTRRAQETLAAFDVAPIPPPPRQAVPPPVRSARPEGQAAPPNIRSQATQLVAPVPVVPVVVPPFLTVAPVAHLGSEAISGTSDRVRPGQGAGGEGNGFGGGGDGNGEGGGWASETPPVRIKGKIRYRDFPEGTAELAAGRPVEVRYHVEADGRPTGCFVTRSSGVPEVDAATCRLIEKRFRYRPSLDGAGRPVRSIVTGAHSWEMIREPAELVRR